MYNEKTRDNLLSLPAARLFNFTAEGAENAE